MKFNIRNLNKEFYKNASDKTYNQVKKKLDIINSQLDTNLNVNKDKVYKEIKTKIKKVYNYILTGKHRGIVKSILDELCKLVWHNPFMPNMDYTDLIKWQKWRETKLGFMIQLGYDRLKLEEEKNLTANELARLSGMNSSTIALYCRKGEIKAHKGLGEWIINYKTAKEYINGKEEGVELI